MHFPRRTSGLLSASFILAELFGIFPAREGVNCHRVSHFTHIAKSSTGARKREKRD